VTGLRILTKRKEVVHASFWGKLKTLSQIVGIVSVLVSFAYAWHLMLVATVLTVWSGFDYFWRIRETVRL
jgi:phosphatidylglycerophosphate synthase